MLTLIFTGIVGVILIIALITIINNKPDIWFWLFLNLYFDPGGYVGGYLDGKLLGPLVVKDVLVVGIIICIIAAKFNWRVIFADPFFIKFLFFLLLFSLYYFIFFGGLAPYFHNDFDYSRFLIKSRVYIYGLIILVAVHAFSLRGLKHFYSITLVIGVICLSLYVITLLTGFELIYIWELQRENTEMTRLMLISFGLFFFLFPLSITVLLLSRKISLNLKYKPWLYYGGILMIMTLLIQLTRRTQIDMIGTIIIIIVLVSYLFKSSIFKKLFKLVIPIFTVSIILFFTLPDYAEFIKRTGEDTFLILTTGKNIHGQMEERVTGTGDLEISKEYIKNNLFLGTGYTFWNFNEGYASSTRGATYARASDAAGEVPIYYALFGFGITGVILMLPLYFMMGKLFFRLIKLLKVTYINYLQDPLIIIFSIYILSTIAVKFTLNLYLFSSDFIGANINLTAVILGIGFALYRKLEINSRLLLEQESMP